MQGPKFTNFVDKTGESRWNTEDVNGVITGSSNQGFRDKDDCDRAIKDHIENTIAASGLSVSIELNFTPIIEYVGYPETVSPEAPPADGPYPEQTVETPQDEPQGAADGQETDGDAPDAE